MTVQYMYDVNTELIGFGPKPWNFTGWDGISVDIGKEFDAAGGSPSGSIIQLIVKDINLVAYTKGPIQIPSDIQFARGTQGDPANFATGQFYTAVFDLVPAVTQLDWTQVNQLTVQVIDTDSSTPLYVKINEIRLLKMGAWNGTSTKVDSFMELFLDQDNDGLIDSDNFAQGMRDFIGEPNLVTFEEDLARIFIDVGYTGDQVIEFMTELYHRYKKILNQMNSAANSDTSSLGWGGKVSNMKSLIANTKIDGSLLNMSKMLTGNYTYYDVLMLAQSKINKDYPDYIIGRN